MNANCDPDQGEPVAQPTRLPRIALMGEFSAGKSTLANLLLGQSVSPVKVTATQLPPVWFSHGPKAMFRIDAEGAETPIDEDRFATISHHDTQAVRIRLESEVLEFCDVIDMPGTSDPNMPQDIWARILAGVDGVVWCTPSTQAWRQTEAAMWELVPEHLHRNSLLLITRMDMLRTQTDRDRVIARVGREVEGLFRAVLPISLTEALSDRENQEVLERSGADRFVENLVDLVESFGPLAAEHAPIAFDKPPENPPAAKTDAPNVVQIQSESVVPSRVAPRRVRLAQPRAVR